MLNKSFFLISFDFKRIEIRSRHLIYFLWYSNLAAQNLDINEILATATVTTKATTPEVTSPETIHEKLLGGINNSFDMLHWL